MGFNSAFKGLNTVFIFPSNTSIVTIKSTHKATVSALSGHHQALL